MTTKSISPYLLIFHFIFICWFNLSFSSYSEGYEIEKSSLILNTDYLGPSLDCFLHLLLCMCEVSRDISSWKVLHRCSYIVPKSLGWQWGMEDMTTDAPRPGVDEDTVTGLPWESVFRWACRKWWSGRDRVATRKTQETPYVLAQTSPFLPSLVEAGFKLLSILFI